MADWTRRFDAAYRFMRVSRATGYETERLAGFERGGTIERNLDTEAKESGSVGHVGALDLGADLVRVWLDATFPDGSTESVALGTFLASTTSRAYDGMASTVDVKLTGRLSELSSTQFAQPFYLPSGTNLVSYAAQIARSCGLAVDADPSDYVSAEALYYGIQSGEQEASSDSQTKLAVINDLLDRAGFDSARTDPYGTVLMRRSQGVADRAPSWDFVEGRNARFLRSVTDKRDTTGVANVVYAVYTGAAEEGGEQVTTIGVATDDDPSSPWSTASLGREIVARYDYGEYATQTAADAKAAELLASTRSVLRKVTMSHVYAPVTIGDAVRVDYRSAGITNTLSVRTQRLTLGDGCLTETEARAYERV